MQLTANSDTPVCGPAGIGVDDYPPCFNRSGYPPCIVLNHSETLLEAPVREGLTVNHSETLLGGPVRESLTTQHSETLLGGPVCEALTNNHSETLLVRL